VKPIDEKYAATSGGTEEEDEEEEKCRGRAEGVLRNADRVNRIRDIVDL
jgi:hypothetical protein